MPIQIVQLELGRPAYLPFHLLAWGQQLIRLHNCALPEAKSVTKDHPNFKLYRICDNQPFRHKGQVKVHAYNASKLSEEVAADQKKPFKFVYYTESDQVVRFDNANTLNTILQASNSSCFFVGRRKEKDGNSDPKEYMKYLNIFRQCGTSGFYVNSEGVDSGTGKLRDKFVRKEKTR